MSDEALIRAQVLRGIALNRLPGFHFPGNFLELSFEPADEGAASLVSLEPGPHCIERDGGTNIGAVAIVADLALAASIRARLHAASRLATVSMHLQFTGAAHRGRLLATGVFEGFLREARATQGLARVVLTSDSESIGFGTGAFMALNAPEGRKLHPVVAQRGRHVPLLAEDQLDDEELRILRHAEAVLAKPAAQRSFISRFWGYEPHRDGNEASCSMKNGLHAGNRVGHAQGGILVGLAACTASEVLPPSWSLSAITASFVSPGEGETLHARTKTVHRGGQTAVLHTVVAGAGGRLVLEVLTTHART